MNGTDIIQLEQFDSCVFMDDKEASCYGLLSVAGCGCLVVVDKINFRDILIYWDNIIKFVSTRNLHV